jgi:hypothetical protein
MGNWVPAVPWNVAIRSPIDATSCPRRTESLVIPVRKPRGTHLSLVSTLLMSQFSFIFIQCTQPFKSILTDSDHDPNFTYNTATFSEIRSNSTARLSDHPCYIVSTTDSAAVNDTHNNTDMRIHRRAGWMSASVRKGGALRIRSVNVTSFNPLKTKRICFI